NVNGQLFFAANDGDHGFELWLHTSRAAGAGAPPKLPSVRPAGSDWAPHEAGLFMFLSQAPQQPLLVRFLRTLDLLGAGPVRQDHVLGLNWPGGPLPLAAAPSVLKGGPQPTAKAPGSIVLALGELLDRHAENVLDQVGRVRIGQTGPAGQ